jgi:membrane protein implicated in regulation of membrane protease activity
MMKTDWNSLSSRFLGAGLLALMVGDFATDLPQWLGKLLGEFAVVAIITGLVCMLAREVYARRQREQSAKQAVKTK